MKTITKLSLRPLVEGNYQFKPGPKFTAREGEGGEGGEGGGGSLSADQVTAINTIVHKAIGSRLSSQSFKDSIGQIAGAAATSAITEASGSIAELVANQLKESLPKPPEGGAPAPGGQGQSFKDSQEYKDMLKREADRDAAVERMKTERQGEVDNRLRTEERTALEGALRKSGVAEERLRGATALLLNEDKVIQRDANGGIVYRINRGEYHDDLDVTKGVAEFLGTDEGKTYLPASGARGTGARGDSTNKGGNATIKSGGQSKEEAAQILGDWLSGGG